MRNTISFSTGRAVGITLVCALAAVMNTAYSAEEAPAVEPEAASVLKRMSDYLGSLEQFTVHSDSTIDVAMRSGQQLQLGAQVDAMIQRPNRFRVNRTGDIVDQEFYFDGKVLTLYGKRANYYARMTVSKNVDMNTALELAREEIGVFVPASDIFYQNAYEALMEDVESGFHAGTATVGGVEVHHLAFRGSEVDWQIWIDKGDMPLPRKYLITSKWVSGAPQFTAVFSDWDTSAKLDDALFRFEPPPGAEEIGFIPMRGGAAAVNQ